MYNLFLLVFFSSSFSSLHTESRGRSQALTINSSTALNTLKPPTQGNIIINISGPFNLDNNFTIDPVFSTTIIHITQSNIHLNLQNFTLAQMNASSSNKNVTGIYIADGLSNITISNGNINNITGTAIIIGQNCFNITLNNLTIAQARGGGIEIQGGTDTIFIENCFIGKNLTSQKDNFGISLSNNKNVLIENCSLVGIHAATTFNAFGILALNCVDCSINNCTLNGNKGARAAGIYLNNCNGFSIENNEAKGNIGTVSTASGLELSNSNGNYIIKYIATQNFGATNAYGMYLHNNSHYNQIKSCACTYQKVNSTGNAYGVCVETGAGNLLKDISTLSNKGGTSSGSEGVGIRLLQTSGNTIKNSSSNYNNGGNGIGYGIYMTDAVESIIEGNQLYYNHGTTNSFGIKEEENEVINTHNLFFSNIAFGNQTNYVFTYLTLNSIQNAPYTSPRTISSGTLGNVSITQ